MIRRPLAIREFFRPVAQPTTTDTYLEIGRRRWEGWPATIIFAAIVCGPLYLALLTIILVAVVSK